MTKKKDIQIIKAITDIIDYFCSDPKSLNRLNLYLCMISTIVRDKRKEVDPFLLRGRKNVIKFKPKED